TMTNRTRRALLGLITVVLMIAMSFRANADTGDGAPASGTTSSTPGLGPTDSPLDTFYGSAKESISIDVPPMHGITPKLAIAYGSRAPNGPLGVGWSLRGTSTIERVSPGRGAPHYDSTDQFLLDGVELVTCPSCNPKFGPCPMPVDSPSCNCGGTHAAKFENY